jgi:hypothetical protein
MSAFDDQARLRPFLLPGERIVWTGRPPRGLALRDLDPAGLSFAAAALALVLYLRPPGWSLGAFDPETSFDLLLLLASILLGIGYFLLRPLRRRRILYAVTSQRVLILGREAKDGLQSHDLAWLPMLLLEQNGAHGTILMEAPPEPQGCLQLGFARTPAHDEGFAFVGIDSPQSVYDIIARESRNRRAELNRDPPQGLLA